MVDNEEMTWSFFFSVLSLFIYKCVSNAHFFNSSISTSDGLQSSCSRDKIESRCYLVVIVIVL
jgi:hypothetical protein